MSDLLTRIARERSDEAFRELFETFSARLRNYMMRQGADRDTAEELAQETLMAVWRKAGLYSSDKGSATAWVFTIARNLRIDRLRKEMPWQKVGEDQADGIPSDAPMQDDTLALSQRQVRVRAALGDLPPEQRTVLELAYVEGLSHGEVSARLGVPLGTVKSRIRLAYQKVRSALEDLQ